MVERDRCATTSPIFSSTSYTATSAGMLVTSYYYLGDDLTNRVVVKGARVVVGTGVAVVVVVVVVVVMVVVVTIVVTVLVVLKVMDVGCCVVIVTNV